MTIFPRHVIITGMIFNLPRKRNYALLSVPFVLTVLLVFPLCNMPNITPDIRISAVILLAVIYAIAFVPFMFRDIRITVRPEKKSFTVTRLARFFLPQKSIVFSYRDIAAITFYEFDSRKMESQMPPFLRTRGGMFHKPVVVKGYSIILKSGEKLNFTEETNKDFGVFLKNLRTELENTDPEFCANQEREDNNLHNSINSVINISNLIAIGALAAAVLNFIYRIMTDDPTP